MKKLQSALEYLTTYGWAILIIAIILGAFLYLGVFNPGTFINSQCIMPADFSCLTSVLQQSGVLLVNLQQNTQYTINITSMGCNTQAIYSTMIIGQNGILTISANKTFSLIQCYNGTTAYSAKPGTVFNGYLLVNYTDLQTGFKKTSIGTLVEKVV
jgi:hypothetical protein